MREGVIEKNIITENQSLSTITDGTENVRRAERTEWSQVASSLLGFGAKVSVKDPTMAEESVAD